MNSANFCPQCGASLPKDTLFCAQCGAKVGISSVHSTPNVATSIHSEKSALTALLLCIFLGTLGIHRFYVGKIGTGILMLITGGGFGIWALIDLILIACSGFKDKNGHVLAFSKEATEDSKSTFKKVATIVGIIAGAIFAYVIVLVALVLSIVFYATSGLTTPIHSQLSALRSGDVVAAYSYTSKDFQNATPIDAFKKFVEQYPTLKNNKSSSFTHSEINNGEGTITGVLQSIDGATTSVEYRLTKEGDTWKITGIHIKPMQSGIGTDGKDKSSSNTTLPNLYSDKVNQFSISYPANWTYENISKTKVAFSGKKGIPSYITSLTIQTIPTKKVGGLYKNTHEVMDDLKKNIARLTTDAKILGTGEVELPQNPKQYHGEYIIASYNYKEIPMKKMSFFIIRPDGQAIYAWSLTSTRKQFDADLHTAKAMYESWAIY